MAVKATATENRNDEAAHPRVEDESSGIVRGYIWGCHTYKWVWILECCCELDTFEYWVDCTFYAVVIAGGALGITQHKKILDPAWKKKLGIAIAEVAQFLNIWGQGKAINRMREKEDHTPSVITLTFLVAITVILLHPRLKCVKKTLAMAAMLFTLSVKLALVIDGDKDSHGYTPIVVSTGFAVDFVVSDTLSHTPFLVLPKP
ncbi:uncharacterized protein LOC110840799 [Zootermopsis nevadensis]|uniref:uncharacterized protein LOC110840799 n=1 Tax=Zootermopsis nevadensis TaxID=136037 RepID=UPI000B8EDCB8|nr:uncharacterized protein LOC110840799 [Zootermopsis nevadensis]